MAQADYTIANQGFPATRQEINSTLEAIATNNSGTSAPATQYAGQFWIDTTASTWELYIHDGTDDILFANIDTSANTVNFVDSALDVVTDTTPELGGNLSLNSNDITGTGNINITGTITASGNIDFNADLDVDGTANLDNTDIDGTLDVSGVATFSAGTVSLPSISINGDTNTGIFFPSADTIAFTEGGTEAMRITSDGRLGVGTTTPRAKLSVTNGSENTSGDSPIEVIFTGVNQAITSGSGILTVQCNQAIGTDVGATIALGGRIRSSGTTTDASNYAILKGAKENATSDNSAGYFAIATKPNALAPVERMRIDSGGDIGIGGFTSPFNGSRVSAFKINNPCMGLQRGGTDGQIIVFGRASDGTLVGNITTTSSSTAYNTSSDYRLKENVNYNFDATTRLKQLKPARFNFKADANKTVDGFLAHEVQDIIPEAITGTKDETETKEKVVVNSNGRVIAENIEQEDWEAGKIPNEEGISQYPIDSTWEASKVVPIYQGIDQSKLTPILTKALQEAIARIEQLEERLTALES